MRHYKQVTSWVAAILVALAATGCNAGPQSTAASLFNNQTNHLLSVYADQKDTAGFASHLTSVRSLSIGNLASATDDIADEFPVNGKVLTGMRKLAETAPAGLEADLLPSDSSLAAYLDERGALTDAISASDIDTLFSLTTVYAETGGESYDVLAAALDGFSDTEVLDALNTSLIINSISAAEAGGDSGLYLQASTVDALFGIGAKVVIGTANTALTAQEIKTQQQKNSGLGYDNIAKENKVTAQSQQMQCDVQVPAYTCDVAWNGKTGISAAPCSKVWECSCPNAGSSAPNCQWMPAL